MAASDCESQDAKDLLARAQGGDTEAFCRLVQPQEIRLFRQAIALCGEESTAEDLVSETLVAAWKSLGTYNQTCRFSTWLYSILLHRYHKTVRKARSRPIPLSRLPVPEADQQEQLLQNLPDSGANPAEHAIQNELSIQVKTWVGALPEKHGQVILLRFFEDASLQDMAVILRCSVGTVKSRLHNALRKLRKMKKPVNLSSIGGDL